MTSHQLINQTSGETEYYTPLPIVDAARRVMGSIELDPASSARANERIRAEKYFTEKDDGLKQHWFGTVWVNHPFGRIANPLWVSKMVQEFSRAEVFALTCITFAATSEEWFQPLAKNPQCYLCPRTNFYLPDGSLKRGVSKGAVVTYMGPALDRFVKEFKRFGVVKVKA